MSKYSAHPALQTKKQTSKATFAHQRCLRIWAGVWGNIGREFRTQRRALNVLSVLRRTARAGDQGPRRARQPDVRVFQVRQIGLKEEGIDLEVMPDD